jgi:acid phosphatase
MCNDAHDCSLATADGWLKDIMPKIFAGEDWKSGRLAVVITADEDDRRSDNKVLTIVMHPSISGKVATSALNHYSLSQFYSSVVGGNGLRNAADANSLMTSFGLPR